MLSAGYLVTRAEMDSWCKKRPEYNLANTNANLCLSASQITDNYYSTCSASGRMPTYSDLSLIRYAVIPVRNNYNVATQIRVGWKVSGGTVVWTSFVTVSAGAAYEFAIEGLPINQTVYFYLDSNSGQNFYVFQNNTYTGVVGDSSYFTCVPIPSTSHQLSPIVFTVMLYTVKVDVHITTDVTMSVRVYDASYDQYKTGTDMLFEGVPWNTTFGIYATGSAGGGNEFYATNPTSFYDFQVMYADSTTIEIEVGTGSTIAKAVYEVFIGVDQAA
jgi:hypothetical protein